MSFQEFFFKLLQETPHNISNSDEYYSEIISASGIYDDVVNNGEYVHSFTISGNYPIDLLEKREENDVICYFVPTNGNNYIYGYVCYDVLADGGVVTTSVYNDKKYPGLALKVYNEYLLGKYKYVMSDGNHTPRGRNFWRQLVVVNLKKRTVTIWDKKTNTERGVLNPNDLDEFYGDGLDYERYRIRIYG